MFGHKIVILFSLVLSIVFVYWNLFFHWIKYSNGAVTKIWTTYTHSIKYRHSKILRYDSFQRFWCAYTSSIQYIPSTSIAPVWWLQLMFWYLCIVYNDNLKELLDVLTLLFSSILSILKYAFNPPYSFIFFYVDMQDNSCSFRKLLVKYDTCHAKVDCMFM